MFRNADSRCRTFSALQRLFALLTCLLFAGTSVPAVAAVPSGSASMDADARAGSILPIQVKAPQLHFTAPGLGAGKTGSSVAVSLQLGSETSSSLKVKLNGRDVSSRFHSGRCLGENCSMVGTVRAQDGLRKGENLLWASTAGGQGAEVASTQFSYSSGLQAVQGSSVNYSSPPSVGISFDPSGHWLITTGYQANVSDPIATAKNLPVTPDGGIQLPAQDKQADFSCTGTLLEALTLNRSDPTQVEEGACGNSLTEIENTLSQNLNAMAENHHDLGVDDIVILRTTPGNVVPPQWNTTDLGGSDYTNTPASTYPQHYMLIGVKGATAQTAHEVRSTKQQPAFEPSLQGTLMKDDNGYYNYVPSGEQAFSVVSGANDGASTTITIGSHQYSAPPSPFGAEHGHGEFWVLAVDRHTLQPVTIPIDTGAKTFDRTYPCDSIAYTACGSVFVPQDDIVGNVSTVLPSVLTSLPEDDLVFIVAAGCPYGAESQVSPDLRSAIGKLGAVPYSLNWMNSQDNACAFSLVSVNDGKHTNSLTTPVALSSNKYSGQGQTGALHGFLGIGQDGFYDVEGKSQVSQDPKSITSLDYTFEQVASSQRVDWPGTDTPGHLMAYHDLSYQILSAQGLVANTSIYDVRFFYGSDTLDEFDSVRTALSSYTQSSWDNASSQEFLDVKNQLSTEIQNLQTTLKFLGAPGYDSGIRKMLNSGQNTLSILQAMYAAADDLNGVTEAANKSVNVSGANIMNLAAGVTSIAATVGPIVFPPLGAAALGVLSGALWTGSAAASLDDTNASIPGPGTYFPTQVASVTGKALDYEKKITANYDGAVKNIDTDWGKLTAIGSLTSDSWVLTQDNYDVIEGALETAVSSGAARSMWLDVLPTLYGIRNFTNKADPNPVNLTSLYISPYGDPTKIRCFSVYEGVNQVPTDSMQNYFNHNLGNPYAFWDTWFLALGASVARNFTNKATDTPADPSFVLKLTTAQAGQPDYLNIPKDVLFTAGPLPISAAAQYDTYLCSN